MTLVARFARSRRTPLVLAGVLGLAGLAWGGNLGYHALVDPTIRIENASGQELWDVEFHWIEAGFWASHENREKQWSSLRPGETRQVSLPYNLYPTAFTAVSNGRRVMENLTGFYVGSRETLLIRILPGGQVVRGHAHMVNGQAR